VEWDGGVESVKAWKRSRRARRYHILRGYISFVRRPTSEAEAHLHTAKLMIEHVQEKRKPGNGYDSIHRGETVDSPSPRV